MDELARIGHVRTANEARHFLIDRPDRLHFEVGIDQYRRADHPVLESVGTGKQTPARLRAPGVAADQQARDLGTLSSLQRH